MQNDAENILKFMRENGGQMTLSDNTAPEKIYTIFHISKAAFKRALGHLFKEKQIEKIDIGWSITTKN